MLFEFESASKIVFGSGTLQQVGELAIRLGQSALVVTGRDPSRAQSLFIALNQEKIAFVTFTIPQEPTTHLVKAGVGLARHHNCDMVIGFGGGSVIDAAKAISALVTNGGEPLDYLEVIGQGQPITRLAAPCIAVPTTAGTGAEVTKNAVLVSPEHKIKVSLRSPLILPRIALVDPLLTHSMPPSVTASTGLDAFTQIIEPFVSHLANPLTDAICREGIRHAKDALRQVYVDGHNTTARENMAFVSLCGGLALANAKLGAVHGFAGVLGGMFDAPHGAICGCLLPYVMDINVNALKRAQDPSGVLQRYEEIAKILCHSTNASVEDGIEWVYDLVEDLEIPKLSTYKITPDDFPTIISKAGRSSSMRGNPIQLSEEELTEIMYRAL